MKKPISFNYKKLFKVIINKPLIITCFVFIGLFMFSLIFAPKLEIIFKLKPDLTAISEKSLEVHFVDVGQGDAILIRLPHNETVLIDSGPLSAKEQLLFYINNIFFSGYEKVFDYVILTHSDADHSGNMLTILNEYKVNKFYRPKIYSSLYESNYIQDNPYVTSVNTKIYNDLIFKLNSLNNNLQTNVEFSTAGIVIGDDKNDYIKFLSPNVESYSDLYKVNNYSPILMLNYNEEKIILTGDATSIVEIEVMNNYIGSLNADVLKLAHHGSSTSTSPEFLEAVSPKYAVISVGKNTYGHPSEIVINNIFNYSINNNLNLHNNILTTLDKGNIIFYINENESINFLTIFNAGDYLFLQWWHITLGGTIILIVIAGTKGVKIIKHTATNI